jgi:hypothetical protein
MVCSLVRPASFLRQGLIALGLVVGVLPASAIHAQAPAAQTPPAQTPPAQTPPAQTPPAQTPPAQAAPPTKRVFASDAGMVLNFIKPDKTADFEATMVKLKEALMKSEKPERKQQAASWKVFKSPDPAGGGNVLYVFMIDPSVKEADYTVSNILAEAFPPAELNTIYKQYADSYAQGQNIINLNLIQNFGK